MTASNPVIGTTILHSVSSGIARITLNRPDFANAVLPEQRDAIIELLAAADRDPQVRVVVIAATGKIFCSGADVSGLPSGKTEAGVAAPKLRAGEGMQRLLNGVHRLVTSVLDCSKPVICAVQGTAVGLGAHLAYASDLVIASEDASFIEAFVLRGLVVDAGGAYLLTRRIGLQKAKELVFLGDRLSAQDAAALGLVNKIVAPAELEDAVGQLASRLANGPTLAISLSKRLLNRALESDRAGCLLEEAMAQEIAAGSVDSSEGVRAFVERRAPQFKGE